jgi:hypothetical protein
MQNPNKCIFADESNAENDGSVTWIQVMEICGGKYTTHKTDVFQKHSFVS